MRRQKGFSLIELLIVVAIILVIAAIAIPNLIRARMSANEASAVESLHTIYIAETAYWAQGWSNPTSIGYSNTLPDLGDGGGCAPPSLTSACQLDDVLANATSTASGKSGYYFTYTPVSSGGKNIGFTVNAEPVVRGSTGQRGFFVDESGVIRKNNSAAASVNDSPIQ